MAEGWISLHRKFLEWEWFDDNNTVKLFIYCLLKANHTDKKWKGIIIPKGSFLSGRKKMALETNLSEQQVRTSLNKLKSTNEITIKTTNLNSLISITNWEYYQNNNQQINQQVTSKSTNKQPTNNQQITTTNNDNNKNNDNNINKNRFNFKKSFIDLGVEEKVISDWLRVRSNKKASNTETAFNGIKKQIELAGIPANECIKISVERSWQGFKADWIKKQEYKHPSYLDGKKRNYDEF